MTKPKNKYKVSPQDQKLPFSFSINLLVEILERNSFTITQEADKVIIIDVINNETEFAYKEAIDRYLTKHNFAYSMSEPRSKELMVYHKGIKECASRLPRFIKLIKDTRVEI